MILNSRASILRCFLSTSLLILFTVGGSAQDKGLSMTSPSKMAKLGNVDPRFGSFNIEMVEVTGGRFWKPYKSVEEANEASKAAATSDANQPVGGMSSLYQYRPPIDLANPRLRKLAEALAPAYIRVSGTWANSTFFQNDDTRALTEIPKGFKGILTRAEWKGVVDFANALNDKIVTSFAISAGTRGPDGVWTPDQAQSFLGYTKSVGGSIAAAEFMNEPTFPGPGGAPPGYDATRFATDANVFESFLRKESPTTVFLGPGGVGEGVSLMGPGVKMKLIASEDVMKATGPIFDAFSYHFYGAVSRRCMGNITLAQALTPEWLDRTDIAEQFYANLRDKYLPGKPLWLSETAESACGGDPFAGQFADTFRYLNQLGTLAQKGVQVVMHNTLASSDYGLLNEESLEPRPDFWAAVLWKRTMGDVVLNPGVARNPGLRVYAACAKSGKGAVALLAINIDQEHEQVLSLPAPAERLALTAHDLASTAVELNGVVLKAGADGSVPAFTAENVSAGTVRLAPASITFLTIASARNKSCM